MKRLHVHVSVDDLDISVGFYSALFAAQPAVVKPDYAKWMLDDPRVNFAISTRGTRARVSTISASRSRTARIAGRVCAPAEAGGNVIEQGRPRAATPSRRSRGSPIPPASHGKPS